MSETDVSGEDKSKLNKENNIAPNTRELVTAEEEGQENVSEDEEPEESPDHPSHLLVQGDPLDALMQPVRSSTRVKYVCLAVSKSCIALGTNTGVAYVFSKTTLRRLHVIPGETDGSVVKIELNAEGNLLACATSKGHVLVSKLYPETGGKPDRLRCSMDHVGSLVVALKWNQKSDTLYIGDDQGRVSSLSFYSLAHKTIYPGALPPLTGIIVRLETPVVQIDTWEDKVLVSTKTKTVLCDTTKHQFSQIGKRPRDGKYGACFYQRSPADEPVIYCSRPGSRVWEVDYEGEVLNTHQFKQLLDKPPTPVFRLSGWNQDDFVPRPSPGPQSIAFPKLLRCGENYLLTCSTKGLYVMDPTKVDLLIWNDQITDVEDVCCFNNEIYLLKPKGDIEKLEVLGLREIWTCLLTGKMWERAAWLVLNFPSLTKPSDKDPGVSLALLEELTNKVKDSEVCSSLQGLVNRLAKTSTANRNGVDDAKPCYDKLDSGIYKIRTRTIEDKILRDSRAENKNEISGEADLSTDDTPGSLGRVSQNQIANGYIHKEDSLHKPQEGPSVEDSVNTAVENNSVASSPFSVDLASGDQVESRSLAEWSDQAASDDVSIDGVTSPRRGSLTSTTSATSSGSMASSGSLASFGDGTNFVCIDEASSGTTVNEPAPVYPVNTDRRKGMGRKVRPSKIGLVADTEKHQGKKSKRSKRMPNSKTVIEESSTDQTDGSSPGEISENHNVQTILPSHDTISSLERSKSGSSEIQTLEKNSPSLGSQVVPSAPTSQLASESKPQSVEEDKSQQSNRMKLLNVKERISSKVKSTTRTVIQNIKDKKSQLGRIVSEGKEWERRSQLDLFQNRLSVQILSDKKNVGSQVSQNDQETSVEESEDSGKANVDIEDLLEATKICRLQMENPFVLYKPDAAREALTTWAIVLNQTLRTLHTSLLLTDHSMGSECPMEENKGEKGNSPLNGQHELNIKDSTEDSNEIDFSGVTAKNATENNSSTTDECELKIDTTDCDNTSSQTLNCEENEKSSLGDEKTCSISDTQQRTIPLKNPDTCHHTNVLKSLKEVRYVKDPFPLPNDVHKDASQLAHLCLSFGCYGNISTILYPPSDLNDCDNKSQESNAYKTEGAISEGNQRGVDQEDEMSVFLRCYFHLLSSRLEETHQVVVRGSCERFERWKTFVTSLLDLTADDVVTQQIMDLEVEAALDLLRSEITQRQGSALAFVVRLYGMAPLRTLDLCAEIRGHLPPLDVLYLTKMGSMVDQHFLFYAKHALNKGVNSDCFSTLSTCCEDRELRTALLTCLLKEKPQHSTPLSCTCGLPWPGAHLYPWPNEDLLQGVLGRVSAGALEGEALEETLALCRHHSYWPGVLKLGQPPGGDRPSLLVTALQLGDFRLLKRQADLGYFPESLEEWGVLLDKRSAQGYNLKSDSENQAPVICLGCSQALVKTDRATKSNQITEENVYQNSTSATTPTFPIYKRDSPHSIDDTLEDVVCPAWRPDVTWERLATLLVQEVGLSLGLEMLQRTNVPPGALPMDFFSSCATAATLQSYQKHLAHNMLERVDTYLWSVRPVTMAPELAMAVLQEKRDDGHSPATEKMFERLRGQYTLPETLEDQTTKWGVGVSLTDSCHVCGLPLQTVVSPLQTGVVFFKCGHGYHCACSSDTSCHKCWSHRPSL